MCKNQRYEKLINCSSVVECFEAKAGSLANPFFWVEPEMSLWLVNVLILKSKRHNSSWINWIFIVFDNFKVSILERFFRAVFISKLSIDLRNISTEFWITCDFETLPELGLRNTHLNPFADRYEVCAP